MDVQVELRLDPWLQAMVRRQILCNFLLYDLPQLLRCLVWVLEVAPQLYLPFLVSLIYAGLGVYDAVRYVLTRIRSKSSRAAVLLSLCVAAILWRRRRRARRSIGERGGD